VLGEFGGSLDDAANAIEFELRDNFSIAKAIYKGSGKNFFKALANAFDIDTTMPKLNADGEEIGEKQMTLDELKEEIAANIPADALLILPEARRLSTGIRFWLEDLSCRMCCFSLTNPGRDIFLDMVEIELSLPDDRTVREAMESEASSIGLNISAARFSQLQSYAGRNSSAARKIIRQEKLGLIGKISHNQYLDIAPLVMAMFLGFGMLRFIGMGTGNRSLYLIGGICMLLGMGLKSLGKISGPRRKVGS